jgi:3-dehydroquinate synthase
MIGTFHQPHAVFCDPEMLSTLSDIDYANGIAEVIKYSVIGDAALFRLLERDSGKVKKRDRSTLHRIITRCAAIKKAVVERDEREEKGVREVLNFGHTVGHAIEALTGYAVYRHGEAVAAGMAAESRIARESGVLSSRDYRRIVNLLKTYDLPPELPRIASKKKFMSMLAHDKKIRNGKIRLSVPVRIGETIMKEVTCERLV